MSVFSAVEILRLEDVPLEKLKVSPTNTRICVPDEDRLDTLVNSAKSIDITEPITVNEDYEIVDGQLRFIVAKKLGKKTIRAKVCRFKSKYHEAVVSFLTDSSRIPLSDRDKYNFVQMCKKMGKSIEDIAIDLGVSTTTVRGWDDWGKTPDVIEEIKKDVTKSVEIAESLQRYENAGIKKKTIIDDILQSKQFRNPDKALELIKASDLPLREFENIKKETKDGLPVDLEHRRRLYQENVKLFSLRIPEKLYNDIVKCMQKESKGDLHSLILELLSNWVLKVSMR